MCFDLFSGTLALAVAVISVFDLFVKLCQEKHFLEGSGGRGEVKSLEEYNFHANFMFRTRRSQQHRTLWLYFTF